MKYAKPELIATAQAACAICGGVKGGEYLDSGSTHTVPAYDADE